MTIKAVLFDAAGTLIYLPRGVGWHYRLIAARHGIELDEGRLSAAFGAAFKAAPARVATGVSRPDDDKEWWRALVLKVLAGCGEEVEASVYNGMFEELYAHFAEPGVWALYPEVTGVLEALRAQYKLGIVSNFDRRLYPVLGHLGIRDYFQSVVISSEVGVDKPDRRIFEAAFAALGVTAEEAVHVGDHPVQDWQAAELAGMRAYRVDRPGQGLEGLAGFMEGFS